MRVNPRLVLLIVVLWLLSGCAAMQESQAIDTERLLAAAGFRMKFADTPEKLDHIMSMAQRKLVPHPKDGKVFFVYADATYCQCVYVGNEDAYQRYQNLAIQKQMVEEQRVAAEMNRSAAMNWGLWGPWGPWY